MRQGAVLLPWLAWLQLSAAACCRSNKCLKDIVNPAIGNGIHDCSANLVVTVTPTQSTLIETVTVQPTEHNTLIETAVLTETVTTTAGTETQRFTLQTTVTEATQTDVVTRTDSMVFTETVQETVTVTASAGGINSIKVRQDTSDAPETSMPAYALEHCQSWEQYVKACKCAGVEALTVTAEALPAATVTVSSTVDAITVSVPSTLSLTETVYVSLTETIAMTETDTVRVTATTQLTQTVTLAPDYVTVTETTTTTVVPAATCSAPSAVGTFKAAATEYQAESSFIYADVNNGVVGPLIWQTGPTSPSTTAVQNKYIWKLDEDGSLALANTIPPYTYNYLAYVPAVGTIASLWPQVQPRANVESGVAAGTMVKVKGCVDPATGELTLDAGGRKNILWCDNQLWMSSGDGSELGRGTCIQMHPKIQAA